MSLIYNLLVIEVLFLVTTAPAMIGLLLLPADTSNVPLAVLCALPLGPAASAALFALRKRSRDMTDLKPMAAFWRGYRLNVVGVLKLWVPLLVWLAIMGVGLANYAAAGMSGWWGPVLVVVAAMTTLWGFNGLVITSLFAFRARDVARLAAYFLVRAPSVTIGNASLLVVTTAVVVFTSEAVAALFFAVLALLLLRTAEPMIAAVKRDFVA